MERMSMTRVKVMEVTILAQALSSGVSIAQAVTTSEDDAPTRDYPLHWIKLHGWLMWLSMGLLMPVAIFLVRFSLQARRKGDLNTVRTLVYVHIFIQVIAVLAVICAALVGVLKFDNNFHHTHERLGVALWILVWVAPLAGFVRPDHGVRSRPIWYAIHWLFGTAGVLLGFYNIYTGLQAYEIMSGKSLRTINILFSIQLAVVAFLYLVQDRWQYLKEQGTSSKSVTPRSKGQKTSEQEGHRADIQIIPTS